MTVSSQHLPPDSPSLPDVERVRLSDGYELAYRLWRPAGEPCGLIVALHGIQSHSGWYGASSQAMADAGYAVAFLDRRGSGENAVDRGHASHVERLVSDVVQVLAHLDRRGFVHVPKVLMAISWGGKLATLIAMQRPELFAGLVLLSPGLCTHVRANALQKLALRTADSAGLSHREVSIPLDDPSLFTDVVAFQEFIARDPLTLRRVTVRFLNVSLEIDRLVTESLEQVVCPTLLVLAGHDRIVDNAGTRRIVESFGSVQKTILEFPDACHTFEFDRERARMFSAIIDWLATICPGA